MANLFKGPCFDRAEHSLEFGFRSLCLVTGLFDFLAELVDGCRAAVCRIGRLVQISGILIDLIVAGVQVVLCRIDSVLPLGELPL